MSANDVVLDIELTALEDRLNQLDLDPIEVKLMDPDEGKGWSLEQADEAAKWYKRYLFLCAKYHDHPLVPVGDIDDFWHQHILDTRKYAADCDYIFGFFLHHFPYFGMRGDDDAAALTSAASETMKLFEQEFGELPFSASSKCHDCKKCTSCWVGDPACKKDCAKECKNVSSVTAEIRPRIDRSASFAVPSTLRT